MYKDDLGVFASKKNDITFQEFHSTMGTQYQKQRVWQTDNAMEFWIHLLGKF